MSAAHPRSITAAGTLGTSSSAAGAAPSTASTVGAIASSSSTPSIDELASSKKRMLDGKRGCSAQSDAVRIGSVIAMAAASSASVPADAPSHSDDSSTWIPFVDTGAASADMGVDWRRVHVSTEAFATLLLHATNSKGGVSSAVHYGGGWVLSTSHGFPTIEHLIGATFSRPKVDAQGTISAEKDVFTVTADSRFFLVQPAEQTLYPDLLFIELTTLAGAAVTFQGFSKLAVSHCDSDDVCVYSHWRDQQGILQLHRSVGHHISSPIGQRTDAASMFWHDAPTRPGASGGLVMSGSGTFLGLCLGGNPLDPRENVALRFSVDAAHALAGFHGIKPYVNELMSPIGQLTTLNGLSAVYQQMLAHEAKLAAQGLSRREGGMCAADLQPQVQEQRIKIWQGLAQICSDHAIPGLVVHTAAGVVFEVQIVALKPSSCINACGRLLSAWEPFVLLTPTAAALARWMGYGHTVLDEVKIMALLNDAVARGVPGATQMLADVTTYDSEIQAGVHSGGTGGGGYAPDPVPHFGIRIKYSKKKHPVVHCHVDATTGKITHF